MALNFSHRPIFATHSKIEVDRVGSQESVPKDVVDLLPLDPFGMDISDTFTAISGWMEDLESDYHSGYWKDGPFIGVNNGLNFLTMGFQTLPNSISINDQFNIMGRFDGYTWKFENQESSSFFSHVEEGSGSCFDGDESNGSPHPALGFALGHLDVKDLLSVQMVCRSLRSTVESDPLLWRNIHILRPMNERLTDDALVRLTNMAQGNLQSLTLIDCLRITDYGLGHVLQNNPKLTKLSIPGCTRLTIDGIVNNLMEFKAMNPRGLKCLRLGGVYNVNGRHFEGLMSVLSAENQKQPKVLKPYIYLKRNLYLSCDDERAIDIETCPKCHEFRLVYDCPSEICKGTCRGCIICVPRCVHCGQCANGCAYEETFSLDVVCLVCYKQLFMDQE